MNITEKEIFEKIFDFFNKALRIYYIFMGNQGS